jgi:hypothetical protein
MKKLLVIGTLFLTACGNVEYKKPEFIRIVEREFIEECGSFGMTIQEGYDLDYNGLLSEEELTNANYVCDGIDGQDGINSVVKTFDPCGDGPGIDEIILLLNDNSAVAWYKNKGLVVLEENKTYQTTDSQKCKFEIINGEVIEL